MSAPVTRKQRPGNFPDWWICGEAEIRPHGARTATSISPGRAQISGSPPGLGALVALLRDDGAGLIFFVVWHYVPIWEAKMAFEQVRIIPPNIWVGLKHFQTLFASPVFYQVLANTLIISGMKLVFVFPVPIIVALLLNEVRHGRCADHPVGDLPAALPELGGDRGHLHRAAVADRRGGEPDHRARSGSGRSTT
jgi:hypothetical protein